jgi:aspartate/methionine/tyrosine aminotransferase
MGGMPDRFLRDVPLAGMNAVLTAAADRGYHPGDPDWINLGQGQPEIGDLPGAPARITSIELEPGDHAYGPVSGVREVREAVAAHYNRLYRAGKKPYTADNVSITAGGRIALNRAIAALGAVDVGYTVPDYAAYNDILDRNMPRIRPVALDDVPAAPIDAFLMSNPRNPSGQVIAGSQLHDLVRSLTAAGTALIADEFYSHYIYAPGGGPADAPVSAAEYVTDPATDPVLVIDGLTKNFRYPGWRLGWIIGPVATIRTIERLGQDLDGGTSRVVQRAALGALRPDYADAETAAVRRTFAHKRDVMLTGLRSAGIRVDPAPLGTFYVWGDLSGLPEPLRHSRDFFEAALDQRVITVPGPAFDLDPAGSGSSGRFDQFVRFSYGPPVGVVAEGVRRLGELVAKYS